jgi:hypothetical protein
VSNEHEVDATLVARVVLAYHCRMDVQAVLDTPMWHAHRNATMIEIRKRCPKIRASFEEAANSDRTLVTFWRL